MKDFGMQTDFRISTAELSNMQLDNLAEQRASFTMREIFCQHLKGISNHRIWREVDAYQQTL